MSRPISTFCGPAVVASALGISRHEAAVRLLEHEPRSRGRFHWPSVSMVVGIPYTTVRSHRRVEVYGIKRQRPTLAQWLRDDGRDAIIFVSSHFVHIKDGQIVEHNGWPCRRGRVKAVILL